MSILKKHLVSLIFVISFALLAGCANLGEIREFGKLSSASAGYTNLTEDYLNAPDRQKKYLMVSETEAKAKLEASAKERKKQSEKLKLYHKAIETYMKAIADLAGDQVTAYDKELGDLVDSATKASLIEKDKANWLKTIAGVLADAATNYYRQKKLSDVIELANAPLQNILQDLEKIMDGYSASIDLEKRYFDSYYRQLLVMAKEKVSKGSNIMKEPVAAQLLTDTRNAQEPLFETRKKAVKVYKESLKTIAVAHQKLYDNRNNLSSDNVLSTIKDYSKKIYDAYKTINQ